MNKVIVVLGACLMLMPMTLRAEDAAMPAAQAKAVEVGNKICPISGEKIDFSASDTITHDGKVFNICCSMCMKEFKKNPELYVKKAEDEVKAASETATN